MSRSLFSRERTYNIYCGNANLFKFFKSFGVPFYGALICECLFLKKTHRTFGIATFYRKLRSERINHTECSEEDKAKCELLLF